MYLRNPQFAGTFYPDDPQVLKEMIEGFLHQVIIPKLKVKPKALIVPHAGYIYSGIVAAYGYKTLMGFKYKRIVFLGPSHNFIFSGLAVSPNGKWFTPLGEVESEGISAFSKIRDVIESSNLIESSQIHEIEHSLEVQIPFLQVVLDNFKIVPILTGEVNTDTASFLINSILDENTLLIVSSDLSHYYSYEDAQKLDQVTIDAILNYDINALRTFGEACGITGIEILLKIAAQNKWQIKLLKAANSGDTSGLKDQVVGYASFVLYSEK